MRICGKNTPNEARDALASAREPNPHSRKSGIPHVTDAAPKIFSPSLLWYRLGIVNNKRLAIPGTVQ